MSIIDNNQGGAVIAPPVIEIDHIYNMDCLEGMRLIPDGMVDAVITDPPYLVSITKKSKMMNGLGNKREQLESLKKHDWSLPVEWMLEIARVLKDGGAFYSWCCPEEMTILHKGMKASGLQVLSNLVWIKSTCMLAYQKKVYRNACEFAVYGSKGKTIRYFRTDVTQKELIPIWYASSPRLSSIERTDHPTQKPISIHAQWVINSCPAGGVVLDPFLGSGTTAIACLNTGRHYIGFELDKHYYEIALERIRNNPKRLL